MCIFVLYIYLLYLSLQQSFSYYYFICISKQEIFAGMLSKVISFSKNFLINQSLLIIINKSINRKHNYGYNSLRNTCILSLSSFDNRIIHQIMSNLHRKFEYSAFGYQKNQSFAKFVTTEVTVLILLFRKLLSK